MTNGGSTASTIAPPWCFPQPGQIVLVPLFSKCKEIGLFFYIGRRSRRRHWHIAQQVCYTVGCNIRLKQQKRVAYICLLSTCYFYLSLYDTNVEKEPWVWVLLCYFTETTRTIKAAGNDEQALNPHTLGFVFIGGCAPRCWLWVEQVD